MPITDVKSNLCLGCRGHGYYWLHKDAIGSDRDKAVTCRDCGGSGRAKS